MMSTRTWALVIVALLAAIALFVGLMMVRSQRAVTASPSATTTSPAAKPQKPSDSGKPLPLSSRVLVTSPGKNAHVGHSFTVAGLAPGGWFFEAQFPTMVRSEDGSVVGRATASAQGEWMTEKQVTFTASMQIDVTYHGKATLVLLKDNPSGLPEQDDSVEIPILVD